MQRILEGISALKTALDGSRKVFLVCDGSWPYLNIGPAVEAAIAGIGSPVRKFSDFGSNPLYESVCKGVEEFNSSGCDTIVAVGGGSSIDVAKCIKLYCPSEPKLIAIPTTAGTGSESTRYAVVYRNGEKQSITHESIIPDFAILEPSVLDSLPLYQKKCTMMDALCQAIESWWSVNATEASRVLSRQAIELIMANLEAYIFKGLNSREIMRAANIAGQAIDITQTTAPHAFSYKLTSLFGLPHGHAVALCLPEIWEFMLDYLSFRPIEVSGEISLRSVFSDIAHAMGTETPEDAISLFRSMMSRMGLSGQTMHPQARKDGRWPSGAQSALECSDPLSEPDRADVLKTLASSVNPIRLANNPVPISESDALAIYSKVF